MAQQSKAAEQAESTQASDKAIGPPRALLRWALVADVVTRVLLIAAAVALAAAFVTTLAVRIDLGLVILLLVAGAVAVTVPIAGWLVRTRDLYRASLIRSAFWLPGVMSISTVVLYIVMAGHGPASEMAQDGLMAVLLGSGLSVVAWFVYAFGSEDFSTASFANSRSCTQLTTRRKLLKPPEDIYTRQLADIMAARDERWVLGTGYLDAWEVLHRAEEARLEKADPQELVAAAFHDWMRLRNSNIPQAESLMDKARTAAGYLRPEAYRYFFDATGQATVKPPADLSDKQEETAKEMVRGVRRAVNIYREERYDRIVRARNQLLMTTVLTALVGYLGLGLALLAGVPLTAVFAASAYFVVGATVGMIVRLRTDSGRSAAIEDYGLTTARLLHTPLLSGVAGIAGVALIALSGSVGDLLNTALTSEGTAPATSGQAVAAAEAEGTTKLVQIFDIGQYPAGLVLAALFGFSPPLLLRGLQRHVDQYKLDLAASEPAGNGDPQG